MAQEILNKRKTGCLMPLALYVTAVTAMYFITLPAEVTDDELEVREGLQYTTRDQPNRSQAQVELANQDSPEIVVAFFDPLVTYTQLVGVPRQREADSVAVRAGRDLFSAIGCSGCHVATLETGESKLEELSGQRFHPFTDLLLHDLGDGLADHRPDFVATGREWRTPPLWGIGLTEQVSGFGFYLHDGRARSVEEAILWHGGEAAPAGDAFRGFGKEARLNLLAFLASI